MPKSKKGGSTSPKTGRFTIIGNLPPDIKDEIKKDKSYFSPSKLEESPNSKSLKTNTPTKSEFSNVARAKLMKPRTLFPSQGSDGQEEIRLLQEKLPSEANIEAIQKARPPSVLLDSKEVENRLPLLDEEKKEIHLKLKTGPRKKSRKKEGNERENTKGLFANCSGNDIKMAFSPPSGAPLRPQALSHILYLAFVTNKSQFDVRENITVTENGHNYKRLFFIETLAECLSKQMNKGNDFHYGCTAPLLKHSSGEGYTHIGIAPEVSTLTDGSGRSVEISLDPQDPHYPANGLVKAWKLLLTDYFIKNQDSANESSEGEEASEDEEENALPRFGLGG